MSGRRVLSNAVIVLDVSGSIKDPEFVGGPSKLEVALKSIQQFLQSLLDNDRVTIILFNRTCKVVCNELSRFDALLQFHNVSTTARSMLGHGTALYDAIMVSWQSTLTSCQNIRNLDPSSIVLNYLMVFTDGCEFNSKSYNLQQVVTALIQPGTKYFHFRLISVGKTEPDVQAGLKFREALHTQFRKVRESAQERAKLMECTAWVAMDGAGIEKAFADARTELHQTRLRLQQTEENKSKSTSTSTSNGRYHGNKQRSYDSRRQRN